MTLPEYQAPELRKKNLRMVWFLIGLALFFFFTSFPFWTGIFRIVGDQAAG